MTGQVDRTVPPIRRAPFSGVANQTVGGSRPDWAMTGHAQPPADAPNVGSGEQRERYLRVKIPPTDIQESHLQSARAFAGGLADRMTG